MIQLAHVPLGQGHVRQAEQRRAEVRMQFLDFLQPRFGIVDQAQFKFHTAQEEMSAHVLRP